MGINKEPYVRINRTNYLDEEGLDALWVKIKEYVALHGGDGEGIDLTQYTTKEELATELSKYYNKTDIDALLSNLSPDVDLSNYYTKTEVDQKINDIDIPEIDLSNYYTKQETYNKTEVNNLIASSGGGEGTGADGFSPIARVEQTETGATITITDKTGTTTATVTNGQDGSNGTDGYSPTIVENSGNNASTYKLDITTKDSTFTTPNLKGADGVGGEVDLSDYYTKTEVDTKLEEVVAGDIDLSNYYTKAETYNKEEIDNKIVGNTYEEYSLDDKYIKRTDVLWDTIPTYSPKTALVKPLGSDYNVYINTTSGDTLYYNDYISYGSSNSEVGTVKDCYIIGTGDGSKQQKYETPGIEYIEKLPNFSSVVSDTWSFGKYHVQKRKVYTLDFTETIYSDETYYMNNADLPDVTEWERDNKVTNPEEGYVYTYKRTKVGEKSFKALEFYEPGVYSFYNKNSKSNTIQCIDSNHNTFESISLNNSTVGQGGMIPNIIGISSVTIGSIHQSSNTGKNYTWVYYIDPDDFDGLITVKGSTPYNELVGDNEAYEGKYKITFTVKQADENGSIINSTGSKECNIYLDSPLLERQYIRLSDLSIYRNISKEIEKGIEEAYTIENPVENLSEWLSDTLVNGTGTEVDLSNYYTKEETYSKTEIDNMLPEDGYSPIATVTQTSTGATISITDKTGTTTATITNGTNGQDGADGEDGFSPTIVENANNNDTTYKLDITTKDSTFTTPNLKGADGTGGGGSGSGFNPFDYSNTNEVAVGTWVDGKTIYRKYFTWSVETNLTNYPKDIHHNIENLETTVLIEGFIKFGATCIPINSVTLNHVYSGSNLTVKAFNEWLQGNFRIQLTDTVIRIGPTNKGGYTAYMFVYYTKSS